MTSNSEDIATLLAHTVDQLTAAGAPFEVERRQINGVELKTYKSAAATLREALNSARQYGDSEFLHYEDQVYSFNDFFAAVDKLAHHLVNHYAMQRGERLAIAMGNCPQWMISFAAIVSIGCIAVPLNDDSSTDDLICALKDCKARLLFCNSSQAALLQPSLAGLCCEHILSCDEVSEPELADFPYAVWSSSQQGPATLPEQDISSGDLALMVYTKAGAGTAKGVVSTHFALCQALRNTEAKSAISAAVDQQLSDEATAHDHDAAILLAQPLSLGHSCLVAFLNSLVSGRKLVLLASWDPDLALEAISREQITTLFTEPDKLPSLLNSSLFESSDSHSLLTIDTGSIPCPTPIKQLLQQKLPQSYHRTGYSIVETNATGASSAAQLLSSKPQSVGKLSPIVDVRVVDANGEEMRSGSTGQLMILSPTNGRQYWGLPEESARVFIDGWVATGDTGFVDDMGFLHIVDAQ